MAPGLDDFVFVAMSSSGMVSEMFAPPMVYVSDADFCDPICSAAADCIRGQCVCLDTWTGENCDVRTVITTVNDAESDEEGDEAAITIALQTAPTSAVTVTSIVSVGLDEVIPSDSRAVLTASKTGHQFTFAGIDDGLRDGTIDYAVTFFVVSSDSNFHGLSLTAAGLTNGDTPPSVDNIEPALAPVNATIQMTLYGRNFDPRLAVLIDGEEAPLVARVGDDVLERRRQTTSAASDEIGIIFELPPVDNKGYVDLAVENFGGTSFEVDFLLFVTDECPDAGTYGVAPNCLPCPEGAECPGGNRVWAEPGYWNEGESSGFVLACDPPERCAGRGENPILPATCVSPNSGYQCNQCIEGYQRSPGGLCVECPADSALIVTILCDIGVWFVIGLAVWTIRSDEVLSRLVNLIIAFQVAGQLYALLDGRMPEWSVTMFRILHLFSGDVEFLQPNCFGEVDFVQTFILRMGYTACIALVLIGGTPIVGYFRNLANIDNEVRSLLHKVWYQRRTARAASIFYVITYYAVATFCVRMVACKPAPSGGARLTTQSTQECFVDGHTGVFAVATILIAFYLLGIPLVYYWKVVRPFAGDAESTSRWSFMYESFKTKHRPQWWAAIIFLGMSIAVSDAALYGDHKSQFILQGLIYGSLTAATIYRRPFEAAYETMSFALSMFANLFATLIIFLTKSQGLDDTTTDGLITGVCVIVLIVILVNVVSFAYFEYQQRRQSGLVKPYSVDDVKKLPAEGDMDVADDLDALESGSESGDVADEVDAKEAEEEEEVKKENEADEEEKKEKTNETPVATLAQKRNKTLPPVVIPGQVTESVLMSAKSPAESDVDMTPETLKLMQDFLAQNGE